MAGHAEATEIIAFILNGRIVLATDSLVYTPGAPSSTKCKIRQTGSIFWAVAGLSKTAGSATSFDVDAFLQEGNGWKGSIPDLLDSVGMKLAGPLEALLPIMRERSPDEYRRLVKESNILRIFAARNTPSGGELYLKELKVVGARVVPQQPKTCTAPCGLGNYPDPVRRYTETGIDVGNDVSQIVGVIDRMMQLGQESEPLRIGPPFTILSISKEGATWLRQNNCPSVLAD